MVAYLLWERCVCACVCVCVCGFCLLQFWAFVLWEAAEPASVTWQSNETTEEEAQRKSYHDIQVNRSPQKKSVCHFILTSKSKTFKNA